MREYKHGRSQKQQERDREMIHDWEESHVSAAAIRRFRTKPYEYLAVSRKIIEKLKAC